MLFLEPNVDWSLSGVGCRCANLHTVDCWKLKCKLYMLGRQSENRCGKTQSNHFIEDSTVEYAATSNKVNTTELR